MYTQNYNGPESIEFNYLTESYFIANSNNGQILELDSNNELSIFASNLGSGPHGLEIVNNILYACSGGRLKGFDLNDGAQILNYNLNGSFLNGITHKENILFITDFSDRKLYVYNIDAQTHDEMVSFDKNPNGTYWDDLNNRLFVVFWGNNAPICQINLFALDGPVDIPYEIVINTGLGNLDGITMDQCGNFYVSAWSSNAIHKYNNDFSETDIVATNMSYPADIFFNQFDDVLAIPNSGNNTISFFEFPCENSSIIEDVNNRKLEKITDLLGRDSSQSRFKIELYDDGSIEKKYIIE